MAAASSLCVNFPPGTVIGMYVGQRYTPDEVGRKAWESAITCLFGLSDGTVIDGALEGNAHAT